MQRDPAAVLCHAHAALAAIVADLPFQPLSPPARRRLCSQLFYAEQELVDCVLLALVSRPALFPDTQISAAALAGTKAAADEWRLLAQRLSRLQRLAMDGFLLAQSGVNEQCRDLLRQVLAAARFPALRPDLAHGRRLAILSPALRVLQEESQRRHGPRAWKPPKSGAVAPPKKRARRRRT